jgi:hypothetical protein
MCGRKHSPVMEPVDASVWRSSPSEPSTSWLPRKIGRIPGTNLRDGGADSLRKGKALSQPNLNAWLIQEALFSVGCRPLDCIRV